MTARLTGRAGQALGRLVRETYGDTCCLCLGQILDPDDWTVQHVVALAAGGSNDLDNLRPAHGRRQPNCPGNYGLGAKPMTVPRAAPSREW